MGLWIAGDTHAERGFVGGGPFRITAGKMPVIHCNHLADKVHGVAVTVGTGAEGDLSRQLVAAQHQQVLKPQKVHINKLIFNGILGFAGADQMRHGGDVVLALYGGGDAYGAGAPALQVDLGAAVAAHALLERLAVAGDVDVRRVKLQQFVYAAENGLDAVALERRKNLEREPGLAGGCGLCYDLRNFHCMFLGMSDLIVSSGMPRRRA